MVDATSATQGILNKECHENGKRDEFRNNSRGGGVGGQPIPDASKKCATLNKTTCVRVIPMQGLCPMALAQVPGYLCPRAGLA